MIPSLIFKSIGQFVSKDEWQHPNVTLQSFEFIYMTEGIGYFFIGDERISLSAGDMLLFPCDVPHGGYRKSEGRVSFIWLHVISSDNDTAEYLNSLPHTLRSVDRTQMPTQMRQLLHRANHQAYTKEINDLSASLIAMEYSLWAKELDNEGSHAPLLNRIKEWIRINSDRAITVSEIAEEFSYNEDYLTRYFGRHSGISLKKYIDEMRMNRMRSLLLTTDMPLKAIASESGFEDYKGFLKYFTYHEGISPTEFRKSCYKVRTNIK